MNDQAEPAVTEVPFGPRPHQVVTSQVAGMMLTLWRERHPAQFGAVLAEVMTGEAPRAERRPRS